MKEIKEFQDGLLWRMQDGTSLVIGVTQSCLDLAGSLIEIDLPETGDEFAAGDLMGEIRGKNAVMEIIAPCALRLTERNEEVMGQPALIEDDPTGDAWILRAEKMDG